MKKNTEEVSQNIDDLNSGHIDMVFVEETIPLLFTYVLKDNIYVFSCYEVASDHMSWIGGKTSEEIIIQLLTDKIDLHDVLLAGTKQRMDITWRYGQNPVLTWIDASDVSDDKLPLHEYMDVDPGEFDKEIKELEERRYPQKSYRFGYETLKPTASLCFTHRMALKPKANAFPPRIGNNTGNVYVTSWKEIQL